MKIYQYENGYDEYVETQTFHNKRKLGRVYFKEHTGKIIKEHKPGATNIICHGTRNGAEQKYFKSVFKNSYVIGTEISETATQFEMTVQHDFAIPKAEWIGKFDILYSNSFDHSIDPSKTIDTWKKQISYDGKIFVEWSDYYNAKSTLSDPVSGTTEEFISFLESHNVVIEEFNKKFGLLMCNVR